MTIRGIRNLKTVLTLLLSVFILNGCAYINMSIVRQVTPLKERVIEGKGHPKILLLNISGFISSRQRADRLKLQKNPSVVAEIRESLQKAKDDPALSGVIIKIDSPGGTVAASDTIYHELMQFKKRTQVPVYACITGLGTSGAYYIAAAADKLYSHPNAITGSIGVIALKFNIQGLMTKLGIEEETIKSGDKKDIFSPFRPLTPEEHSILQTVIDQLHERFVDVIYNKRNSVLSREDLELLSDGRIYTADTALEAGLIDRIGYMDEVISEMKETLGVDEARVISYHRAGDYVGTIYSSSSLSDSSFVDLLGNYAEGSSPFPGVAFLYVWNP